MLRKCAVVRKLPAAADAFGCSIGALTEGNVGPLSLRGRVHSTRVKGRVGFAMIRQPQGHTLQIVAETPDMIERMKRLTPESVVQVQGTLGKAFKPVKGASCSALELGALTELEVLSAAATPLPFPLDDRSAKMDTRLDHRPFDLRTPANDAVFRLVSAAAQSYRGHMASLGFTEIHTPKLIGTPSEGGGNVFGVKYFDKDAYLAQSPQLYKQMCVMGDMPRVYEVGSVFRAEKSNTHRHMTEFMGLDAEMVIHSSYHEVLLVLESAVVHVLSALQATHPDLIATAQRGLRPEGSALPDPAVCTVAPDAALLPTLGNDEAGTASQDPYGGRIGSSDLPVLRMPFAGAMRLLVDGGVLPGAADDFNTASEKALGRLIKERYGVDLVVVDAYPSSIRPFYTMPVPEDPTITRSYDVLLRGEEICSGAQRLHDADQLTARAEACGVTLELVKDYIDAFRYGAYPHGGFGLGLQRLVMFFLDLPDVRLATLFPRDPKRIAP